MSHTCNHKHHNHDVAHHESCCQGEAVQMKGTDESSHTSGDADSSGDDDEGESDPGDCCSREADAKEESDPGDCCTSNSGCSGEADDVAAGEATSFLRGNYDEYEVVGMDCGSCAQSIEKHLKTIPGITDAQVNFATGKMKVAHHVTDEKIIKEVNHIGFKAYLPSDEKSADKVKQSKADFGLLVTSGVMIAGGFLATYTNIPEIVSTILFAMAIIISGYRPIRSAYYALKSRSLDMNVLMAMAAIGAAIIGEWFEGATVVWLFSLGNALQARSMEQTRKSIHELMDLTPPVALIKSGGAFIEKRVEEISKGDIMLIKPGDRLPLDGEVISGTSSINQAPITGESIPVDKYAGDEVYAGTINESGSLEVEVTKLSEDTAIAKIIHLVEEAQEKRAPSQAFIDKFASIYTPIVFVIAISIILLPPLFQFGTWGEWAYKGLALLIIACPCALVISTPVAIVSAIGNAAKNGVLIKGGTFLERAGKISMVAFDKTGTLTEGKPVVTDVHTLGVDESKLLEIISTLEEHSTHPIAKAILTYAEEKGIQATTGEAFQTIAGKGVQAQIAGQNYFAGNRKLFTEEVLTKETNSVIDKLESEGKTIIIVGTEQSIIGVIAVADQIRPIAVKALSRLKDIGVNQSVMLTGDNEGTAKMIAKEASIDQYVAQLLPEGKVDAIQKLQSEGHDVAMVGDGINDAPALATADLGIAMGGVGTDTAMETADIVLMADNLEKLPYTMRLSRKALGIIKQNIYFSILIKLVALLLIFPGWLTLWLAILSDTGAAIIVILNSLRLVRVKD